MDTSGFLHQLHDHFILAVRRRNRMVDARNEFKGKPARYLGHLTPAQQAEVRAFWARYGVSSFNLGWVDFYSSIHGRFDKRFIPQDLFFTRIDLFYSNAAASQDLDDKNNYDLIYKGVRMPQTVVRKVKGVYLDAQYRLLTFDEAVLACRQAGSVILKPSVMSTGGHGIHFWNAGNDVAQLERRLRARHDLIVQEIVVQHPAMARLHPASLNTIRIMTLFIHQKVHVLSSIVRMGAGGSRLDNLSAGGYACGIRPDGRLKAVGFNTASETLTRHPQGAVFADQVIPHYADCVAEAKRLALRLLGYTRLVSWDFAIDQSGHPVLIETNLSTGGVDFHQIANGPVFGDLTEDVLHEVFSSSTSPSA